MRTAKQTISRPYLTHMFIVLLILIVTAGCGEYLEVIMILLRI